MEHDEYTGILRKITLSLKGEWEHDRDYLSEQAARYVNYPLRKEILRAIGRLLAERMPENARSEFERICRNDGEYYVGILDQVRVLMQERRIDAARSLIDKILPSDELYDEDEVSVLYSFKNLVEFVFFVERFKPEKDVRFVDFPFNEIYELLMYVQVEQGDLDGALETSQTALRRNQLNTTILFEAAEIWKMRKKLDRFLEKTVQLQPFLYWRHDLARYFRNLGYYFIESSEWDEAVVSYFLSNHWHPSEMAQSQLYYIARQIERLPRPEEYGDWHEMLESRGLPVHPDVLWPRCAWSMGRFAHEKDNLAMARFCYSIVFDLTGDEEAKELLEQCGETPEDD